MPPLSRLKANLWSWVIGPDTTRDQLARSAPTVPSGPPPSEEQKQRWAAESAEYARVSGLIYRPIPLAPERRAALIARLERGEIVCNDIPGLRTGTSQGASSRGDGVRRLGGFAFDLDYDGRGGGRAILMEDQTTQSWDWYSAGHAWLNRWWQDGWPVRYVGNGPRPKPWLRYSTGAPDPALLVDCECACECGWYGRLDETGHDGGVLRCAECVASGHPPDLRGPVTTC